MAKKENKSRQTDISCFEEYTPQTTKSLRWLRFARKVRQGVAKKKSLRGIMGLTKAKVSTVRNTIAEIRRASVTGKYKSLEHYFNAGRPCAHSKKVVA